MIGVTNGERFSQLECLMESYFKEHIAPIMGERAKFLQERQAQEMLDYSRSAAGILSMITSSGMPMGDPYQTLKLTGEWNSKTTEDYIAMCKEAVVDSESVQKDLAVIASQWRSAVVSEVGREQYDKASEQIGCDLAYAYLEQRLEDQMIDKLVEERMPKSSADYIVRKSMENTLFGLPQVLSKSPLTAEIEARGEAAYQPNAWEKGTGYAVGAVIDTLALGGGGSWAGFAKLVGIDVALSAAIDSKKPIEDAAPSVEMCISQGVFGSEENLFEQFRSSAKKMKLKDTPYLLNLNKQLSNKLKTESDTPKNESVSGPKIKSEFTPMWNMSLDWKGYQQTDEKYKDVPLVVARGYEEQYLQSMAQKQHSASTEKLKNDESAKCNSGETVALSNDKETIEKTATEPKQALNTKAETTAQNDIPQPSEKQNTVPSPQTNENGWKSLSNALGLSGIGDVTMNLGYVFAMLPDVLLGALTGRTKELNMKSSMLPLATIMAGMFVKNPLLKTLLIGLGGMNLLNKAGHEVLPEKQGQLNQQEQGLQGLQQHQQNQQVQRFKQYADEPLNSRISNPVLQGNSLIADIDHIPCTIYLPDKVVEAHKSGALPLNTIANAVLAQNDKMQSVAGQHFEADRDESRVHTIGIQ